MRSADGPSSLTCGVVAGKSACSEMQLARCRVCIQSTTILCKYREKGQIRHLTWDSKVISPDLVGKIVGKL